MIDSARGRGGALRLALALLSAGAAALTGSCGARGTEAPREPAADLVVYSSHPTEMARVIVREFRDRTGLRVRVVSGGTGELLSRIRSEAVRPEADILWGGGAESLAANVDLFEPYVSPESSAIPEGLKDPRGLWTGFTVLPMVILVNGRLLPEAGAPKSWADLGSKALRGSIAYADPEVSGSAYTILRTIYLAGGAGEPGWALLSKLAFALDGVVLPESSLVFRSVASGEYLVGLSYENSAADAGRTGSDVRVVYPSDGTSAVPDGVAVVRGGRNGPAARRFEDFVLGPDVASVVVGCFGRRSARIDAPIPAGLPSLGSLKLVPYDVVRAAAERVPTLARFRSLIASSAGR